MKRCARIERKTSETDIMVEFEIDGTGSYSVQTPAAFLNHMLELFARHGLFNLSVLARGDTAVDFHHTVEDIGICLGQAIVKALSDKAGICRYGEATVPMDEALAHVALDLSGRPCLVYNAPDLKGKVGEFDSELVQEFLQALVNNCKATLHINVAYGKNSHHIIEAVFKALARALDRATQLDGRVGGVPSTKGVL
ncbi:MAG: imidazoleglycerol-phosphate dehydratase HisB [Proteobacteria bacterium]|nr:imidazoleglycerol-phosphate dehydratase HisB [Pseudomonadota bacterium]